MVEILLADPRVDPNARDHSAWTPLHSAAAGSRDGIVVALLADPRVDVTVRDAEGNTPLHLSAKSYWSGAIEVVLADPRVDPAAVNDEGVTTLHTAALRNRDVATECILRDPRVDPLAATRGVLETALHVALTPQYSSNTQDIHRPRYDTMEIYLKGPTCVPVLLRRCPRLAVTPDGAGLTPLHLTASWDWEEDEEDPMRSETRFS